MAALILTLAFCAYLVAAGYPVIAGTVATGLTAAVVGIFVTGRRADLKVRELDTADE